MPNAEHRIYIKLPPAATPDELKTHFSEFGKIIDVYIPLIPATQKPKVGIIRNSLMRTIQAKRSKTPKIDLPEHFYLPLDF